MVTRNYAGPNAAGAPPSARPYFVRGSQAGEARLAEYAPWSAGCPASEPASAGTPVLSFYASKGTMLPVDGFFATVCWSPELGLYTTIEGGGLNIGATSPDGVFWTQFAVPSTGGSTPYDIAWSPSLGLFAAVGSGGLCWSSPDGATWTPIATGIAKNWASIAWSPELSLFAAVSYYPGDTAMTSPDAVNWTPHAIAGGNDWVGICWASGLGLFVAVGTTGTGQRVVTSSDGAVWNLQNTPADLDWYDVAWSPELGLLAAVAVGGTTQQVMTSTNGIDWILRDTPSTKQWLSIAWSPDFGIFVAVSYEGGVMISSDGINWTMETVQPDTALWVYITYSSTLSRFCAMGSPDIPPTGKCYVMMAGMA